MTRFCAVGAPEVKTHRNLCILRLNIQYMGKFLSRYYDPGIISDIALSVWTKPRGNASHNVMKSCHTIPLSLNLQKIMDGSKKDVVYFNMGTI